MDDMPPLIGQVHTQISAITREHWDRCAGGTHPFTRYDFFAALEETDCIGAQTGWAPHILTLQHDYDSLETRDIRAEPPLALLPMFVKSHSYGEYVFDHSWAGAFERAGGQYYPKLLSAIPFTPVTGPRFLVSPDIDMPSARRTLARLAVQIAEKAGLSSLHINFLQEEDATALEQDSFLVRHDQQFHWQNKDYGSFDDFLGELASRKRKQIRKERRTVQDSDIVFHRLQGDDIKPRHWDAFYAFYTDTGARKWGTPYLTRDFFTALGERMAEDVLLILCEREGQPIAGALNLIGRDTLYGRYWGCLEDHPCLHFETCYYRAIDYAIEHGLQTVEAGAQGAHKLARGYVPSRTYSAHWITNPAFRDAVARYLDQERMAVRTEMSMMDRHAPFKRET